MGRRVEQTPENYSAENFDAWNARSRENLGVDTLDLVQLHCPPTPVYTNPRGLRRAGQDGRRRTDRGLRRLGGDLAEALEAIARPHVATVQIILNCFRLKPLEQVLPGGRRRRGRSSCACRSRRACCPADTTSTRSSPPTTTATSTGSARSSTSARRSAGVPFEAGLQAVARAQAGSALTESPGPVRAALDDRPAGRLDGHPGCAQPRAGPQNAAAADLPPLTDAQLGGVREVYDRHIREHVHDRW